MSNDRTKPYPDSGTTDSASNPERRDFLRLASFALGAAALGGAALTGMTLAEGP